MSLDALEALLQQQHVPSSPVDASSRVDAAQEMLNQGATIDGPLAAIWRVCGGMPAVLGEYKNRKQSLQLSSDALSRIERDNDLRKDVAQVWLQMASQPGASLVSAGTSGLNTSFTSTSSSTTSSVSGAPRSPKSSSSSPSLSSHQAPVSPGWTGKIAFPCVKTIYYEGSKTNVYSYTASGSSPPAVAIHKSPERSVARSPKPSTQVHFFIYPNNNQFFLFNHAFTGEDGLLSGGAQQDRIVHQMNAQRLVERWLFTSLDETGSISSPNGGLKGTVFALITPKAQRAASASATVDSAAAASKASTQLPRSMLGWWCWGCDFIARNSSTVKLIKNKYQEFYFEWARKFYYLRCCEANSSASGASGEGEQGKPAAASCDCKMTVLSENYCRIKLELISQITRFLIDALLGIVLALIIANSDTNAIVFLGRSLFERATSAIQQHIRWLMGWPAGLKLNDNLDTMLGNLSLAGIEWWNDVLQFCAPLQFLAVYILIVLSFCGGLSCVFAFLGDVLGIISSHLLLFYMLSAKLHSVLLRAIQSLWRLFRGKKKNVLRGNRIDDCNYSTEQLVLGTLFFTLFVFLYPTVAVYFFSFGFIFSLIQIIQVCVLSSVVTLLRHMPFSMLMLWMLGRLPFGGLYLELVPPEIVRVPKNLVSLNHFYFNIRQKQLSLGVILRPLFMKEHKLLRELLQLRQFPSQAQNEKFLRRQVQPPWQCYRFARTVMIAKLKDRMLKIQTMTGAQPGCDIS